MTTTETLQNLPPERWGRRLARMRDLAGLTQEQANARLKDFMLASESTISRLEKLDAVPASEKRRAMAWTLCVLYGYDPRDLDLTADDAPPAAVLDTLGVDLKDPEGPKVAGNPVLSVPA